MCTHKIVIYIIPPLIAEVSNKKLLQICYKTGYLSIKIERCNKQRSNGFCNYFFLDLAGALALVASAWALAAFSASFALKPFFLG